MHFETWIFSLAEGRHIPSRGRQATVDGKRARLSQTFSQKNHDISCQVLFRGAFKLVEDTYERFP